MQWEWAPAPASRSSTWASGGSSARPTTRRRASRSAQVTLEELVTRPGKLDGKIVTVKGQFRGGNLFGDLPSASRKHSVDWVIKDELFAAWVTGKKPKGPGFEFDRELKRDTGKWLQITGRVMTERGVVTIEATDVTIAKAPAAEAASAPARRLRRRPRRRPGRRARPSSSSRCRSTASARCRRPPCSRSSSARTWTRRASRIACCCATRAGRSRATASSTPCASATTRACARCRSTPATSCGPAASSRWCCCRGSSTSTACRSRRGRASIPARPPTSCAGRRHRRDLTVGR